MLCIYMCVCMYIQEILYWNNTRLPSTTILPVNSSKILDKLLKLSDYVEI